MTDDELRRASDLLPEGTANKPTCSHLKVSHRLRDAAIQVETEPDETVVVTYGVTRVSYGSLGV
jgi:hypothetical protein